MAAYRMTPARRRALRKAQLVSARRRRGKGHGKLAAAHRRSRRNARIAVGTGAAASAVVGAVVYSNSYAGQRHRKVIREVRTARAFDLTRGVTNRGQVYAGLMGNNGKFRNRDYVTFARRVNKVIKKKDNIKKKRGGWDARFNPSPRMVKRENRQAKRSENRAVRRAKKKK